MIYCHHSVHEVSLRKSLAFEGLQEEGQKLWVYEIGLHSFLAGKVCMSVRECVCVCVVVCPQQPVVHRPVISHHMYRDIWAEITAASDRDVEEGLIIVQLR